MGLTLQTAPAEEPVSLTEAKKHLRLEHTADDTFVTTLIVAARKHVERVTGRSLVTQTWNRFLDEFPDAREKPYGFDPSVVYLARGPVQSVTHVKYYDEDGTQQTFSALKYLLDVSVHPARLDLVDGEEWPVTQTRINAIEIRFVCGYGLAVSVPEDLKAAVLLLIGHWYENREAVITGTISKALEFALDAILDSYPNHASSVAA